MAHKVDKVFFYQKKKEKGLKHYDDYDNRASFLDENLVFLYVTL